MRQPGQDEEGSPHRHRQAREELQTDERAVRRRQQRSGDGIPEQDGDGHGEGVCPQPQAQLGRGRQLRHHGRDEGHEAAGREAVEESEDHGAGRRLRGDPDGEGEDGREPRDDAHGVEPAELVAQP